LISGYCGNKYVITMVPAVKTATANGTGVDRNGYGSVVMVAQQGISGDTLSGSLKWTISFQESDNNSTFTAIADADLEGGVNAHVIDSANEDPTTIVRGYLGSKRYVRITWTATGTHTNGTPVAGLVILGNPNYVPVTQPTELGG
jgi:hypothetical protein